MRKKTLAVAIAATSAALALGSLGLTGTAKADPGSQKLYNAVGSNTTTDVLGALAGQTVNGHNWATASGGDPAGTLTNVGSYDATGSTNIEPITPEPNPSDNGAFLRPNGSGAGAQALSASLDTATPLHTWHSSTIVGEIQFARASAGPAVPDSSGPLDYVPFARDAVGYIWVENGTVSLASLTDAQLISIYEGNQPISGVTIAPYLPQSGSGTRAFFISSVLGGATLGSDVVSNSTFEENTASVIGGLTLAAGHAALYPMSAGAWIAQVNGFSANTGTSTVHLGKPDSISPTAAGNGGLLVPNPSFYSSSIYGRDLYNVFATSEVTASTLDGLASQFVVTSANPSPAITSTNSQTIIEDFGFEVPTYSGIVSGASSHALKGDYTFSS
jgi:ABC-type phosphate transport system substrate-binding protein